MTSGPDKEQIQRSLDSYAGSYLDFGDAVRGQLDVGEVALAERHRVHRVSPDTLDLLAHRVGVALS